MTLRNTTKGTFYSFLWDSQMLQAKELKEEKTEENLNKQIFEAQMTKFVSSTPSTPEFINCAFEEITEDEKTFTKIYIFQEYLRYNLYNPDFLLWLKSSPIQTRQISTNPSTCP